MKEFSRRSVLGMAAAAVAAPLAVSALPARATAQDERFLANDAWTHVASRFPSQSYWKYDRDSARSGLEYASKPPNVWRSFYRIPLAELTGLDIVDVKFSILLTHSAIGSKTPVDLFQVGDIDPEAPLTWQNSADSWQAWLASAAGSSWGSQPDQQLDFSSSALLTGVRAAVAAGAPYLSFGLRNPDEHNQSAWKKFDGVSAGLSVTSL